MNDRVAQQLENLRQLCRKLDAMPTENVADDGLSNRDHDKIIYDISDRSSDLGLQLIDGQKKDL